MSVKTRCTIPNSLINHVACRDAYPVKWRGQSVQNVKYLQGQVYTADLMEQKPTETKKYTEKNGIKNIGEQGGDRLKTQPLLK